MLDWQKVTTHINDNNGNRIHL